MLWDSDYTPQLRHSYLLGRLDNMSMLEQSPHLVIDGTFKTAPPNSLRSPCWSITRLHFDQLSLKFGLELLFAPAGLTTNKLSSAIYRQKDSMPTTWSPTPTKTSFSTLCAMPYDPEEDIKIAWKELKLTLPPEMTSFARYYNLDRNSLLASPLRQRVLGPSRLYSDASTTLFEYSRRMEQRLRFTCQLPKSNYMELSRMRQEGASHHGYEDR